VNIAQLIVQLVKISCYLCPPPSLQLSTVFPRVAALRRIVPHSRRRTYHRLTVFSFNRWPLPPPLRYATSEVMDKGQFDLTHSGIILRLNLISANTNR
jgi:hypothetical protein